MKKLLYIALITIFTSVTFSSCTEESIEPANTQQSGNNGGSGDTDPI